MAINNEQTPYFSIIIPLYNKENYVAATLKSVIEQTFKNFEIVIVNDGSTDTGLEKIIQLNISNLKIINQTNSGVSSARNKGIDSASGKFIAFLDADDYWFPNHLQNLYDGIHKFSEYSVFCTNYKVLKSHNRIVQPKFNIKINNKYILINDYFSASLKSNIALTSCVCIRTEIMTNGFYFDTNIRSGQDTDLWIRLALNYKFVFCSEVSVKHLKTIANSLSKSNYIDDRLKAIEKNAVYEYNNQSLKKYLDLNRTSIALQYKKRGDLKKCNEIIQRVHNPNDLMSLKRKIAMLLPSNIWKFLNKN